MQTVEGVAAAAEHSPALAETAAPSLAPLASAAALERRIVQFWSDPQIRRDPHWGEHRDINEVMLATSLPGFEAAQDPISASTD